MRRARRAASTCERVIKESQLELLNKHYDALTCRPRVKSKPKLVKHEYKQHIINMTTHSEAILVSDKIWSVSPYLSNLRVRLRRLLRAVNEHNNLSKTSSQKATNVLLNRSYANKTRGLAKGVLDFHIGIRKSARRRSASSRVITADWAGPLSPLPLYEPRY
ncbi:hypothetical protein EVAR_102324_1 [Eumeta japonica]|uniref:Uncharacterized protein n=1 Tax=Eumeta variegata TaxID=151549 RepID=A0A4C1ZEC5_EUMVA|nr:hypothetical protein EVAR_102324_1 [Eumeta japonica]